MDENISNSFYTDFYEFTMLQSALVDGTAHKPATFELFGRKLPKGRRYGVVAGTQRAISAIENFSFTEEQVSWLRANTALNEQTLSYLENFSFTGRVTGLREGDLYFPYDPVLSVESTFGECVLLETVLLSIFNHDSAVASAASRMVQAARGVPIIEMGSRRTNEKAAPAAARAAYLTGFTATSNIAAAYDYGVPITGTSAHAFTLAHKEEQTAFRNQVEALGESTTLLVDTYDIAEGIDNAIAAAGEKLGGVRIDSGDLYEETLKARKQLDAAGNTETKIVLSSDIDEFVIQELGERNIPVDGIGAGTKVVTGSGHPTAGMVYKLVEIDGRSVSKRSENKISVGGTKKVYRDSANTFTDYIVVNGHDVSDDVRILESGIITRTFIKSGEVVFNPDLEESREFHASVMGELSETMKSVQAGEVAFRTEYIGSDVEPVANMSRPHSAQRQLSLLPTEREGEYKVSGIRRSAVTGRYITEKSLSEDSDGTGGTDDIADNDE